MFTIRRYTQTVATLSAGMVIGGILALAGVQDAHAAKSDQPYGGCDEAWQAPHSEGAETCRDLGWVVRKNLVVGPRKWVRMSALPSCKYEDGTGHRPACSWNFGSGDGNGEGNAYWVTGTHNEPVFHYVKGVK